MFILALSVFVFKFVHLATVVLTPGFLGNIQQYRSLQTGHALVWVRHQRPEGLALYDRAQLQQGSGLQSFFRFPLSSRPNKTS
jgi:hypothetical protein